MYRVDIREHREQPTIGRRAEVPASERDAFISRAVATAREFVISRGGDVVCAFERVRPAGDRQVEIEAGVCVRAPLAASSDLRAGALPAGTVAAVAFESGGDSEAQRAVASWAKAQRRVLLGAPWIVRRLEGIGRDGSGPESGSAEGHGSRAAPGGGTGIASADFTATTLPQAADAELLAPVSEPEPPLILASTSSARRALMDSLGLPYTVESPGVAEDVPPGTPVALAVAMLAERKALAVAARNPGALVLGADQLVSLDGQALGKPADRAAARSQLTRMLGRTHQILTGVCLVRPGGQRNTIVDEARLTVDTLSPEALERYLDLGEWEGCAGAYRVEGQGQALFTHIDGDRTSVQGLPLQRVLALLRSAGVNLFRHNAG